MKLIKKLQPIRFGTDAGQQDITSIGIFKQKVNQLNNSLSQMSLTMRDIMQSLRSEHSHFASEMKGMSSSFMQRDSTSERYIEGQQDRRMLDRDKSQQQTDRQIIYQICHNIQKVFDNAFQMFSRSGGRIAKIKQYSSENIIKNILHMENSYKINTTHIQQIEKIINNEIIPYLICKYTEPDKQHFDTDSQKEQLQKKAPISEIEIKYRQDGDYSEQIVKFINTVIVTAGTQIQNNRHLLQQKLNKITQSDLHTNKPIEVQYTGKILPQSTTKKITSLDQIKSDGKHADKAAIWYLLKFWCKSLYGNFDLNRVLSDRGFMGDGKLDRWGHQQFSMLRQRLQIEKMEVDQKLNDIKQRIWNNVSRLGSQKLAQQLRFINKQQAKIGQFCYLIDKQYQSYLFQVLNILIHGLTKVISKEKYPNLLIPAYVPKLTSYRITASRSRLQDVVSGLGGFAGNMQRDQYGDDNQVLVNLGQGIVQLEVDVEEEGQMGRCSRLFCQYLEELRDCPLGFFAELCDIWVKIDPRSKYISQKLRHYSSATLQKNFPSVSSCTPTSLNPSDMQQTHKTRLKQIQLKDSQIHDTDLNQLRSQSSIKQWTHVDKINIERNCVSSVRILAEMFPRLRVAFLGWNYISRVGADDVVAWRDNLQELHINDNQLMDFSGLFTLHNLLALNINQIGLKTLPTQITKLQKLQYLDMSQNQLTEQDFATMLAGDKLQKLKNLNTLVLYTNRLEKLPKQISLLPGLKKFDISKNTIKQLPTQLAKLINLQDLNVSQNKFDVFPKIITKLPELRKLNIGYNNLINLPDQISKLQSLQQLNICNNSLEQLPEQFGKLKHLKILTLSYNQLNKFPSQICQVLSLTSLGINYNKFRDVPRGIGHLRKLEYLNLSDNMIQELCEEIGELKYLRELLLNANTIKRLPQSMGMLTNLRILQFQRNCVTNFPQNLCRIRSLTHIDCSNNELKAIPESIGNLQNLESIDFSENKIQAIPTSIGQLHRIRNINIERNQIRQLPRSVGQLRNLAAIFMNQNQLESLPEQIGELQSLKSLYIQGNRIRELPRSIGKLKSLHILCAGKNQLVKLPKQIGDLVELDTLSLEDNKISQVPQTMGNMKSLSRINLLNNRIKQLPKEIYNKLKFQSLLI